MSSSNLSQITSEIPDFIGGLPKRRKSKSSAPPVEFDQYFDYKSFYGEAQAADADSPSRSDASSIPGLTSGPSEEDGAPSPRPNEDALNFKAAVKQIKQHDDIFTVPAREIRPNGVESYPYTMDIDSTLGSNGTDTQASGSSSPLFPASSNGASSPCHSSSSADSPLSRGKRHRPLDNPEKVAQMRKIGACFRCKTRKVTCDQQSPCSRCKADAAKCCNDDGELAEHMCFRRTSNSNDLVFQVIWRTEPNLSVASQRGVPQKWDVFFEQNSMFDPVLPISVSHDEGQNFNGSQRWQRWQPNQGQASHQYVWNPEQAPEDRELIEWASWQMSKDESSNFQAALDTLVRKYAQHGQSLPHHDLVRKVHEMRCMYRIWRHQKFFCQRAPGSALEELPSQICQSLKRIVISRMKAREADVLTQFWKILDAGLKPHERLPLWACMMQFILMYRNLFILNRSEDLCGDSQQIQSVTTSLFNNLVVMCEICFSKKKPEAIAEDGNSVLNPIKRDLNVDFRRVETRRDEFYQAIQDGVVYSHSYALDRLFCVLLVGSQRSATRAGARATKRARR